jgi:hypothetical protein
VVIMSIVDAICNYVAGPLIVVLFYWFRFHSVKGTRSYTTKALYYMGVGTFILPFVLIYLLLWLENFPPLLAVWILILMWLVPIVPAEWRRLCHGMAKIPFYAYALRDVLSAARFEVPPTDMAVIRRKLARFGYRVDDFSAVQSTSIQSRFLKIAAIMHYLEQWNLKGESFMARNSEQYSELLNVFDLLSFKVTRTLKNTAAIYGAIMDENKVQPGDWRALDSLATQDDSSNRLQSAAQTAAGSMLEDLRKDMDFLLDKLLLFIARAALANERNFAGRKRRLEEIGFTATVPAMSIKLAVAACVIITMACSMMWLPLVGNKAQLAEGWMIIRLLTLPSLNILVNFLMVYHFKRNYAFADEKVLGEFPLRFVLLIGFFAAVLMFPVRAFLDYFQYGNEDFVKMLVGGLPLSLYPWATGAVMAVLVQDSVWSAYKSERMKRIMDGIALGGTMAAVILLLWVINAVSPIPHMKAAPPSVALLTAFSFVFGFMIGCAVIDRLRQATSLQYHVRKTTIPSTVLMPA